MDAGREDVLAIVHIDHLAAREQPIILRAGQYAHAAILAVGFSGGQPDGGDFHRFQGPIAAVLMPEDFLAVLGRFGDVVGGPHGDVGSDELFGNIDQAVIADQTVHEGVGH